MTQDKFALALSNPQLLAIMLEHKAQLARGTRKKVEQFINNLIEETERHNAAQDALSLIQGYALWKVDQSLSAGALIKEARNPRSPQKEMDAFDQAARKLYLESAATAMQKTMLKVVDKLDQ